MPGRSSNGELQADPTLPVLDAPSGTGAEVARLSRGQIVVWYPLTQATVDGDDWVWIEARLADGRAVRGWMARVRPEWTQQFKPLVAPPLPAPAPRPGRLTPAELAEARALSASLVALRGRAVELTDELAALQAQLDALIDRLAAGG